MGKEDTRVKDRLDELKQQRATAPSRAQVEDSIRHNDELAYKKNISIAAQLNRHKKKVVGNAKLNEDEYNRKKGRMKMLVCTYPWEQDAEQEAIDEARLKAVYEDTKEALAYELTKIDMTVKQIEEQQERMRLKHPEFAEFKMDTEEALKKLDEEIKSFEGN